MSQGLFTATTLTGIPSGPPPEGGRAGPAFDGMIMPRRGPINGIPIVTRGWGTLGRNPITDPPKTPPFNGIFQKSHRKLPLVAGGARTDVTLNSTSLTLCRSLLLSTAPDRTSGPKKGIPVATPWKTPLLLGFLKIPVKASPGGKPDQIHTLVRCCL